MTHNPLCYVFLHFLPHSCLSLSAVIAIFRTGSWTGISVCASVWEWVGRFSVKRGCPLRTVIVISSVRMLFWPWGYHCQANQSLWHKSTKKYVEAFLPEMQLHGLILWHIQTLILLQICLFIHGCVKVCVSMKLKSLHSGSYCRNTLLHFCSCTPKRLWHFFFSCTLKQKEHGLVKNNIYCMSEVLREKELDYIIYILF